MTEWGRAKTRGPKVVKSSDPATFRRAAAIMCNRCHVTDRGDVEPDSRQSAQRTFATGTGALHFDFERAHAVFLRLAARIFGGHLRSIRCRFTRAL